jgi:hypothetical protein
MNKVEERPKPVGTSRFQCNQRAAESKCYIHYRYFGREGIVFI